jgi:hypothetical protein
VQRLFVQGLGRYGCMGVGLGAMLVGEKLYGYRGGLLARVEGVGWLPVVWVVPSLRQRVRAQSRLRALGRLERYGWALRERYRIEQVFGSVKRAYGSYLGCRGAERGVERVGVWGVGVEWLLCVGRVSGSCAVGFWLSESLRGVFTPARNGRRQWFPRGAGGTTHGVGSPCSQGGSPKRVGESYPRWSMGTNLRSRGPL